VTQWTNEKVFSGEKTQLSAEFTQFEKDVEIKKNGIERYVISTRAIERARARDNQLVKRIKDGETERGRVMEIELI
jgi:hypothetical protein